MTSQLLSEFIRDALRSGAGRRQTQDVLLQAGWTQEQVNEALAAYAELDFPVPVPRPKAQVSARDAFLYLLMFSMLYLCSFQLGNMLFQFINLALPDVTGRESPLQAQAAIRFATSALLIGYPVFLFTAVRIQRHCRQDPAQLNSAVRKWLTYLTLTFAAGVIVGDLVFLLYSLLSGELSLRVLLKTLVVGVLAGAAFSYYLWQVNSGESEIRGDEGR